MEVIILLALFLFFFLNGTQVKNKLFVYKDDTENIQKSNYRENQFDPHLMNISYYGLRKELDGFVDKNMMNDKNLEYTLNKSKSTYNEYVNKIVQPIFEDDIRKDKTDIQYNIFLKQDKQNPKYDNHNIRNFYNTQKFQYEFPTEYGIDYINGVINRVNKDVKFKTKKTDTTDIQYGL